MHWLFLLLALGALILAFSTPHLWLLLASLLAALLLMAVWARGQYRARMGEADGNAQIVDPVELHRLRTLAAARRAEQAPNDGEG